MARAHSGEGQMGAEMAGAGDPIPATFEIIEVHVEAPLQLFNAIDPAPLRSRDLDPRVEQFIVDWARESHHDSSLALRILLDGPVPSADEAMVLRDAVRQFFRQRALETRRRLRRLFSSGRTSLVIGLAVLVGFTALSQLLIGVGGVAEVLHTSLAIGGWVAMWRPLEVFLYDWWPIRAEAQLFDRLAAMPVRVQPNSGQREGGSPPA